jgi:hypothetical protein
LLCTAFGAALRFLPTSPEAVGKLPPRRTAVHSVQYSLFRVFAAAALLFVTTAAWAVPASDTLLPTSTKAYVSVAHPVDTQKQWEQTQFGQLLDDPTMQPFVKSLKKQLEDKFSIIEDKLGITWDDLQGVTGGELSLALLERPKRDAAMAITIDVTGHEKQADKLLAAIEKKFTARGGKKRTVEKSDTTLLVFDVPAAKKRDKPQQTVYFIKDHLLCGVDDRAEAEAMLGRFSNSPGDNLSSVKGYAATMERCQRAAGKTAPEVRWFVEPFGLVWAMRSLESSNQPRYGRDVPKILSEQGFDAIQGIGGYVNFLEKQHVEILHRTCVYAPPVKGKENDPLRWNSGMQIMQLPNVSALVPQSWVPRMSASYTTVNVDTHNAFDHVDSLFDALAGHADSFQTTLEGMEKDPYGPQVNIRDEFVAHLGSRVTIVTDYSTPITVKSERSLFAIEAADEGPLADTLAKIMKKEPDVVRREMGDIVIWERVPPESAVKDFSMRAPSLSPLQMDEPEQPTQEEEKPRVLPNSAVCVALGQLMMASDIDFLRELLAGFGQREMLVSSADYKQAATTMDRVAPGPRCAWSFARTDEAFRPTYELIRQGKMPESESLLGKLLNDLLTTEVEKQEGVLRRQEIDGSQLPSFEMVRRYFGTAGRVLQSEKDGWLLSGVLLDKEAP